jgi:hypothetical protein
MTAPAHPLRDAIQADRYDLAALRLLHGFLIALNESAPEARDELVALLPRDSHGRSRA